jgi:type IV secretory pathway VirB10-like protein
MRSLFNRDAGPAPAAEAVAPGGWDGMRGGTKLALGGVAVAGLIAAVVLPGMGQRAAPQLQNQEPRPQARINEYEPPASRDILQDAAKAAGLGGLTGSNTPAPGRRRAVPTEMALFAAPVQSAAAAGAGKSAATADMLAGEPGGIGGGGTRNGINGGADGDDRLAAHLSGATTLPTMKATLVRNSEFTIRAGDVIPCLPIDAQNSGRPGFTSCRVPEWYRSSDQRRGLLPPGTRIFGQIRTGMAQGEMRLGVLYTEIQTPRFKIALAAPGADALGRAGLDGDVQTFFWERAKGVALYALLDVAIGAGQAAGSAALSRSLTGSNGGVVNFGNIGGQAQGLASQEMASQVNRRPVLTRDQAMPMTVTVGQDLDFTGACKQAMQVDPMACPLL